MSRYVVLLAMLLVQTQPLIGSALCQGHHDQPGAACGTGAEHHQSGTDHSDDHGDHTSDDQCAATHACAAAAAVIRADGPDEETGQAHLLAMPAATTDCAPLGLRSPPFQPPKS